jgi:hypothetical protein
MILLRKSRTLFLTVKHIVDTQMVFRSMFMAVVIAAAPIGAAPCQLLADRGGEIRPLYTISAGPEVVGMPDINGDHVDDFIVATRDFDADFSSRANEIWAISGADGARLWTAKGGAGFGHQVIRIDDVNNDGFADVAVSSVVRDENNDGIVNIVHALSGRSGAEIWRVTADRRGVSFGEVIQLGPDIDSDGIQDLIISWSVADPKFSVGVCLVKGADGSIMSFIDMKGLQHEIGSIALVRNGIDNQANIAIGDPLAMHDGSPSGAVLCYDLSGSLLKTYYGPGPGSRFGYGLASAGDVDGDKNEDLVVSAIGGPSLPGTVIVMSGASGKYLHVLVGSEAGDGFGTSFSLDRPIPLDVQQRLSPLSARTICVAVPNLCVVRDSPKPVVNWYSIETGKRVGRVELGEPFNEENGISVLGQCSVCLGDVNGDSVDDWLLSINRGYEQSSLAQDSCIVFSGSSLKADVK